MAALPGSALLAVSMEAVAYPPQLSHRPCVMDWLVVADMTGCRSAHLTVSACCLASADAWMGQMQADTAPRLALLIRSVPRTHPITANKQKNTASMVQAQNY
jgi:hypothetical protein